VKDQPQSSISLSRLFLPSYSDLFFLFIILWSFMAGELGWQRLLLDGDTGLHIRIGDLILANHTVPTRDLFSFSKPAQEWYAFEWLSETFFAFLHGRFALKGVALASGIVIAAALTLLLRYTLRQGANCLIALALALLTVNANSFHFHARPHIFTLLFLTIAMWLISADRQKPSPWIWILVPMTVVWTNMHGGFLMFFPLLALLVIGSAVEAYLWLDMRARRKSDTLRYTMLALACGLASLINPYGIKLHVHVVETMRASWIIDQVDEFSSPRFRDESQMDLMILLFLGLMMVVPLLRKRRVTEPLWIVFLAYCALKSVRHGPLFTIVAMPIAAVMLSDWWSGWVGNQPKKSIARVMDGIAAQMKTNFDVTSLWAPLAILFIAVTGSIKWPTDFPSTLFPVSMAQRYAEQIAPARILTTDQWADYLIYHNYPRQRVFLDGRANYYGEKIVNDYRQLIGGAPSWKQILDRYQFNLILCPSNIPLTSLLKTDSTWRIVDSDEQATLFAPAAPH
jgi:hypothetical protein